MRHAPAPQPDLGARLSARSDLEILFAFDGRDACPRTQRGLDDRHLQVEVDLGPFAAQDRVWSHVHGHVEVAGRAAADADLALAREPDLMAFVDAGRDRDPDLLMPLGASFAAASTAGRGDDAALAVATIAGRDIDHLSEHRLADAAILAAAAAGASRHRHAAGRGPGPGAGNAPVEQVELDLLLDAADRLVEGDAKVVAQVGARLAAAPPAAGRGAAHAGKETVKQIAEATEALREGRSRPAHVAQAGSPDEVVDLAALGIGQDLIGLVDFLEPFRGLSFGVDVRVPLLGELAEGALDIGVGRGSIHAQDLVVASFACHLPEKDTRRAVPTSSRGQPDAVARARSLAGSVPAR